MAALSLQTGKFGKNGQPNFYLHTFLKFSYFCAFFDDPPILLFCKAAPASILLYPATIRPPTGK